MTGWGYAWRWLLRTGLFLAATIGFPVIVWALVRMSGCRTVSGACGALALVAGVFLKPAILVLYMIFLVRPAWRRLRTLGEPRAIALLLPLLVLADAQLLVLFGTHWSVAFSMGAVGPVAIPYDAGVAVLLMILLSVMRPAADRDTALRLLHGAMLVSMMLLIVVGLAQLVAQHYPLILAYQQHGRRMTQPEVIEMMRMQRTLREATGGAMAWLGPATTALVVARIAAALVARLRPGAPAPT